MSRLDKFFKEVGDAVRCSSVEDATHLVLTGGKYRIADNLADKFLMHYSDDLGGSHKHCLTEVATGVCPFFVDLDVFDPCLTLEDAASEAVRAEMAGWVASAARSVAACAPPREPREVEAGGEAVSALRLALSRRDALSASDCVVLAAPPRSVIKDGVEGTKIGVHIIWPALTVRKPDAQRLRNVVVVSLRADFPARPWDDIVDVAVYRPMSSLRMLGSYKPCKCAACDNPAVRLSMAREAKLRPDVGKALGLSSAQSRNRSVVAREAREQLRRRSTHKAKLREYVDVCEVIRSCPSCHGKGKVPDLSAGHYNLTAVYNEEGEVLDEITRAAENDPLIALHLCSVRRPAGTSAGVLRWPAHAPAAPAAVVRPAADGDDDDERVEVEVSLSRKVPEQSKGLRFEVIGDRDACARAFQAWLNAGAFAAAHSVLQVSDVFRLVGKGKVQMENAHRKYTVVVTVRGFGSQYCLNVGRDHTSNHIYFVVDPSGRVSQRCHSSRPGCDGVCGEPKRLPSSVYTLLFPFHPDNIKVRDDEVADWMAGRIPESFLRSLPIEYLYCGRDDGDMFRFLVQKGRGKLERLYLAECKRNGAGVTALGKRAADGDRPGPEADDGDFGPDHGDADGPNDDEAMAAYDMYEW